MTVIIIIGLIILIILVANKQKQEQTDRLVTHERAAVLSAPLHCSGSKTAHKAAKRLKLAAFCPSVHPQRSDGHTAG